MSCLRLSVRRRLQEKRRVAFGRLCQEVGSEVEPTKSLVFFASPPVGRTGAWDLPFFFEFSLQTLKRLPSVERENCSPQMLFVCVLYTANEESEFQTNLRTAADAS